MAGLSDIFERNKIKKGKKEPLFNTEEMMPISEMRGETMILKDGGMRAILKVQGINLDLKNYEEQQIVLEQYKKFLN
jgi:S-methylmethionine-dependent homocysteine/selenocysteine methylase